MVTLGPRSSWRLSWLPCLLAALIVGALALTSVGQRIEFMLYDGALRAAGGPASEQTQVALVAIDARSIDTLGRWPWTEEQTARLVELLAGARVSAIGLLADFSAATQDQRIARIEELLTFFRTSSLSEGATDDLDTLLALTRQLSAEVDLGVIPYGQSGSVLALTDFVAGASVIATRLPRELSELGQRLEQLAMSLDLQGALAGSMRRAGNVVLPLAIRPQGGDSGAMRSALPGFVIANSVTAVDVEGATELLDAMLPVAQHTRVPTSELGNAAAAVGHVHLPREVDGVLRRQPLFVVYQQQYVPSMALAVAAIHRGLRIQDLELDPSRGVVVDGQAVSPNGGLDIQPRWRAGSTVARYSAADIFTGRVPATELAGMAVVVGVTDPGTATLLPTPSRDLRATAEHVAAGVAALLTTDSVRTPGWGPLAAGGAFLLVLAWLILALPRLHVGFGIAATLAIAFVLVLLESVLLRGGDALWLKLGQPALLAITGLCLYLMMRPRPLLDAVAVRGDDLANAPVDTLAEPLREPRLPQGEAPPAAPAHPDIGSYRVVRLLGDGTLGQTLLASAPSGGAQVVIRTVDPASVRDRGLRERVRDRMFKEAEAAAALHHPNIAAVLDYGDADGLLYLVESRVAGESLERFTRVDSLLELDTALGMVARIAEALDYAHDQGVVHRGLRPSAILFDQDSGVMHLTGFGVGGMLAEGLVRPGRMPGGPVYLAPEQVAGEAGDRHVDLYAAGVLMYELIGGAAPFEAGSLTQLMYRIANEQPRDILELRPDLSRQGVCVQEILARALARDPARRYHRGMDLAADVRRCAQWLAGERL